MPNADQPTKYLKRDAKGRAKSLAKARKRAGVTQEMLDEQYRAALAKNPQANVAGGRR